MNNIKSQPPPSNFKSPHHSDGSELVPAEVQASDRHSQHNQGAFSAASVIPGTTVDDEGLINNFAVEPKVYLSEYPSPRQQRRYLYWGIAATLLVASLVAISTFIS